MVPWNAYDQIGIVKSFLVNSNALSLDLLAYLDHIQEIPDRLKPFYDYLLSRTKVNTKDISSVEIDLQKLNQDLQELSSRIPKVEEIDTEMQEQVQGWELVSGWQKCPIGVLPGSATVGNLDLDPSYDDAVYFEPVIPISSSTIETKLIPTVVLL
jgi:hypothetical protein